MKLIKSLCGNVGTLVVFTASLWVYMIHHMHFAPSISKTTTATVAAPAIVHNALAHDVVSLGQLHLLHAEVNKAETNSTIPGLGTKTIPVFKKHVTEVVVFVPTPVPWEARRAAVHAQFLKEGWTNAQVVLLFVLGTRDTDTSAVTQYSLAQYVRVPCFDEGDRPDDPEDNSATTCKVYEALKHVVTHFEAKYVWRGADDSYLNLPLFFRFIASTLPDKRLYYGRLRNSTDYAEDLQLTKHPRLQEMFGLIQWGQYMHGMGYLLSYDVADFIAALKIPPHLTWYVLSHSYILNLSHADIRVPQKHRCEDVMVGMWLNPFQIQFLDGGNLFYDPWYCQYDEHMEYLVIHRMQEDQWQTLPAQHIDSSLRLPPARPLHSRRDE